MELGGNTLSRFSLVRQTQRDELSQGGTVRWEEGREKGRPPWSIRFLFKLKSTCQILESWLFSLWSALVWCLPVGKSASAGGAVGNPGLVRAARQAQPGGGRCPGGRERDTCLPYSSEILHTHPPCRQPSCPQRGPAAPFDDFPRSSVRCALSRNYFLLHVLC